MSTLKVNNLQVGQDSTATNNLTWFQPGSPDGTIRLGSGNAGSATSKFTFDKDGNLTCVGTINAASILAPIEGTLDDWIIHAGDTNTKFGFPANDTFSVETAGQQNVQVNGTRVFLKSPSGTDTTVRLQHQGNSGYGDIILDRQVNAFIIDNDPSNASNNQSYFSVKNKGTDNLRITSDGQIGVNNTSPDAWHSTYKSVQIYDAAVLYGSQDDSFVGLGANHFLNTSGDFKYSNTDFASRFYQVNGGFHFESVASGTAGNTLSFTEKLCIASDGKVGIGGATSPEELLDLGNALQINLKVGGRAYLGQGYSTAATILGHSVKAKTTGTVSGGMEVTETNSGGGAPTAIRMQSGNIEFHTAGSGTSGATFDSERLRIHASGNVSIIDSTSTQTAADSTLQINGTNNTNNIDLVRLRNTAGSAGTACSIIFENGVDDMARIQSYHDAGGADKGGLRFWTAATKNTLTARMDIDKDGRTSVGRNLSNYVASSMSSAANDFIVTAANGSNGGMSIVNSGEDIGNIFFAQGTSENSVGRIQYEHANNAFSFTANSNERLRISNDGTLILKNNSGMMMDLQSSAGTGQNWIEFSDTDGTRKGYFGYGSGSSEKAYWVQSKAAEMAMYSNGNDRFVVQSNGIKVVQNGRLRISSTFIDFSGSISTPSTAAAIYRPADNTLAFSTANTERLKITSTGEINFANVTVAQKNTSGDIVIDIGNLTNNGSNYWRKVGVWIMYNGIKPDATNNYSVVYYAGVGSVSTWNWLGDEDTLTSDSFSSVALQNAAATSFRLYCDINNQNVGNVFVMVHAWNTKPTVTIN